MQTSRDLKMLDAHIPAHGLVGMVLSHLQDEQGGRLAHASQTGENKTVWKMYLSFKRGGTTDFYTCSRGSEEQSTVHLKDPLGSSGPTHNGTRQHMSRCYLGPKAPSKQKPTSRSHASKRYLGPGKNQAAHLPLTNRGLP